jgi:chorismate dehydratase
MSKIKIALVSYINTIPFIKAIQSSDVLKDKIELIIDYPAKCAELIKSGQVDGGLIPVGALN